MLVEFIPSIDAIDRDSWQNIWASDYPFIQYEFLQSLEQSQCVSKDSGWIPHHFLLWSADSQDDKGELLAAMPLYIKSHSYGEYVFDWAWADAYHRYGVEYYPKLLNAIPFTPATGPRYALAEGLDETLFCQIMLQQLQQECQRLEASSFHSLFPSSHQLNCLTTENQLLQRDAIQFHWINENYKSFDDFLASFKSRKRKSLKSERRKVAQQGVEIQCVEGADISAEQWQQFYHCYHLTYLKRSGRQGYLNHDFFKRLATNCTNSIMMVQAHYDGQMVAAALYFKDSGTLYGRYWGCLDDFDALHFEACYYQGIEYAIENKLKRFDPGAQGEHKIQRGFKPSYVHSAHWIASDEFRPAIEDFLKQESEHIKLYKEDAESYLPFKSVE
ncbi:GNAT family N-acetyltransferase [uncultured Pseudoteredinibacter sp.]|uniref:GNAT family N-acetyltransferase n=1 Tax=uncultured Pseudoteredinibacter sp. TaxID=1641701 RepID=UPI00262AE1C6|nr:GNAT family N-acetyltransferase [uncultured Pseudoteredinibacter sp.]